MAREVDVRALEDDSDRVTEDDSDRLPEQGLAVTASLSVTLGGVSMAGATARSEIHAVLDPIYYRVIERSPSTLHPEPPDGPNGGEVLHRVTELWRVPDVVDYRILQHQGLGTLRLTATAEVRVHVGERHFLWASRARLQCTAARYRPMLTARSDFRKTRKIA